MSLNQFIFLCMKLYSNSFKLVVTLLLTGLIIPSYAQKKLVSSYEAEMDYAFGAGTYGLFLKANHPWTQNSKFNWQSGISAAFFMESDALSTDIYERKGILFDPHANINSGFTFDFFQKKIRLGFDLYAGMYLLRRQGAYSSDLLVFTESSYMSQKTYFDWGSRISFAYNLSERIGLQLTLNKSFNDWSFFHGTDYSKLFFGFGILFYPK
jgi:hypothetical protein